MSTFWQGVIGLGAVVLGAWVVPAVGMRLLVPSLESSARTSSNYRGRRVFLGLGIVWVFWAIGISIFSLVTGGMQGLQALQLGIVAQVIPILLVFLFGLIDDSFGAMGEKGLRGHLRALVRGRLTTGALKLVGITFAALWASGYVMASRTVDAGWTTTAYIVGLLAGTVLIAGAANLLNLLDLRPGRALKSYGLLAGLAWLIMLVSATARVEGSYSWMGLVVLAVVFAGPALAVWRYDIGERGMLGDAGANPAGALAGVALAVALPLWGIVVAAVAVVVLNIISERVSFSQVIGANRVLRWLDALGRLPGDGVIADATVSDDLPRHDENDG